jgi:hypothetical protein
MSGEQFTAAYREQATQAETAGAWPEFWRRLHEHLVRFGHAIYDLDFAKALLIDDPAQVLETLKFFLSDEAPDPNRRQAEAEAAREQATGAMLNQRRGLSLKLFRPLVETAQRFAPLREDALADAGLGWPILRRMLQEIGRRLVSGNAIDTPEDVFWLRLPELQEAVTALDAGQHLADFRTLIRERRATWESERALTPPVTLPLKGGARFLVPTQRGDDERIIVCQQKPHRGQVGTPIRVHCADHPDTVFTQKLPGPSGKRACHRSTSCSFISVTNNFRGPELL